MSRVLTIVGISTFMSMINFSWVEHENIFITPGFDFPVPRIGYVLVIALHQAAMEKLIVPDISFFTLFSSQYRPRGHKTFFMLNSTEHEISTAHKN